MKRTLFLAAAFLLTFASGAAAQGNPQLKADSIYKNAATDGTDLGANFDIAGVIDRAINGAPAQEQTPVKNPSKVEWTCPDHDADDQHELKIIRIEGTNKVVITTILLGDPAYLDAAAKTVGSDLNVQPIAFGEYVARIRIRVTTPSGPLFSDDSPESNGFQRVPGGPSKVIVK